MPHLCGRLRQVDIKAEHFERQVQLVEQERDDLNKKYEVRTATIHDRSPRRLCISPAGHGNQTPQGESGAGRACLEHGGSLISYNSCITTIIPLCLSTTQA